MSRTPSLRQLAVVAAALAISTSVRAQQPASGTPAPGSATFAPNVGQMAPDFSLPGATRYGLLKDPVKLSDYRGQTVVLALFPKARTKG